MKITQEQMWDSINRVMFPEGNHFTAKECGYVFPEALKQCAVVMVRDDQHGRYYFSDPNQWVMDQQNVIDALRELKHNGFLTFKRE